MCRQAFHFPEFSTWVALKSKTARWQNRLNMDAQAQAIRDRKRLMKLAQAWVKRGKGPAAFVGSVWHMWPTGYDRLGAKAIQAAWHVAEFDARARAAGVGTL